MHELGLIQEVLDVVSDESRGARVRRIVLEVGSLAAVLPEALRFAFELAREGTVAEEAELEIVETRGGDELVIRGMEIA
jgi:hydrogenase nickel incorporation protein HypA/HybF